MELWHVVAIVVGWYVLAALVIRYTEVVQVFYASTGGRGGAASESYAILWLISPLVSLMVLWFLIGTALAKLLRADRPVKDTTDFDTGVIMPPKGGSGVAPPMWPDTPYRSRSSDAARIPKEG